MSTGIENGFKDLLAHRAGRGEADILVLLFYYGGSAIGTTVGRAQTLDRTIFDCQSKNMLCLILKNLLNFFNSLFSSS